MRRKMENLSPPQDFTDDYSSEKCPIGFSYDDFEIPFSQNLSFLNCEADNALARGGDVVCGLTL